MRAPSQAGMPAAAIAGLAVLAIVALIAVAFLAAKAWVRRPARKHSRESDAWSPTADIDYADAASAATAADVTAAQRRRAERSTVAAGSEAGRTADRSSWLHWTKHQLYRDMAAITEELSDASMQTDSRHAASAALSHSPGTSGAANAASTARFVLPSTLKHSQARSVALDTITGADSDRSRSPVSARHAAARSVPLATLQGSPRAHVKGSLHDRPQPRGAAPASLPSAMEMLAKQGGADRASTVQPAGNRFAMTSELALFPADAAGDAGDEVEGDGVRGHSSAALSRSAPLPGAPPSRIPLPPLLSAGASTLAHVSPVRGASAAENSN